MKYIVHAIDFHRIGDSTDCQVQATDPNKPRLVQTLLVKGGAADNILTELLNKGSSVEMDLPNNTEVVGVRVLPNTTTV